MFSQKYLAYNKAQKVTSQISIFSYAIYHNNPISSTLIAFLF